MNNPAAYPLYLPAYYSQYNLAQAAPLLSALPMAIPQPIEPAPSSFAFSEVQAPDIRTSVCGSPSSRATCSESTETEPVSATLAEFKPELKRMASHKGGRSKHVCSFKGCNKTFVKKTDLIDHYNAHKGLQPFACTVCGKRFARRNALRAHEKKHQSAVKHLCPVPGCGQSFSEAGNRKQHYMSSHLKLNILEYKNDKEEMCSRNLEMYDKVLKGWSFEPSRVLPMPGSKASDLNFGLKHFDVLHGAMSAEGESGPAVNCCSLVSRLGQ